MLNRVSFSRSKALLDAEVKHCLTALRHPDNQAMLDAAELAKRLVSAMDERNPPISGASLAAACGVTAQAVSGWRKDGRIAKKHLQTIAGFTGKPLEYFLESEPSGRAKVTRIPSKDKIADEKKFFAVFRAWQDTGIKGRELLLDAAETAQRTYGPPRARKSS